MMAGAERVFVGLGANLGAAHATFAAALQQLQALPQTRLVAASSFYTSAPVGADGPEYLNAVAELSTELEPLPLLRQLLAIEQVHGRRRPYANAPRTLDLDLLLYGQRALDESGLRLPHPRLHRRAFVLQPLLELAPLLSHPSLGAIAGHLAATSDQLIRKWDPR